MKKIANVRWWSLRNNAVSYEAGVSDDEWRVEQVVDHAPCATQGLTRWDACGKSIPTANLLETHRWHLHKTLISSRLAITLNSQACALCTRGVIRENMPPTVTCSSQIEIVREWEKFGQTVIPRPFVRSICMCVVNTRRTQDVILGMHIFLRGGFSSSPADIFCFRS